LKIIKNFSVASYSSYKSFTFLRSAHFSTFLQKQIWRIFAVSVFFCCDNGFIQSLFSFFPFFGNFLLQYFPIYGNIQTTIKNYLEERV